MNTPSGAIPRWADNARCGFCSTAPAHTMMRSRSRPPSTTVGTSTTCSLPARNTVRRTDDFCTARSTSRNRFTTTPSTSRIKSPLLSSCAAGEPPTSRCTPSTFRRSGLCCSMRVTHASVRPSLRALASGTGCSSASSECRARPSRTNGSISISRSAGNAAILLQRRDPVRTRSSPSSRPPRRSC